MMRSNPVGRPAVWHKPILEYVEEHGEVRALELRVELGVPKRTLYNALRALVASGVLTWHESNEKGNYRVLRRTVSLSRLDMILCQRNF